MADHIEMLVDQIVGSVVVFDTMLDAGEVRRELTSKEQVRLMLARVALDEILEKVDHMPGPPTPTVE